MTDPLKIIASGYETHFFPEYKSDDPVYYTLELLKKFQVEKIIIGYPRHMNGDLGTMAVKVDEFVALLQEKTTIEVERVDERLSTVLASKRLIEADVKRFDRKKIIDMMAAQVLLQDYLERKK
jgi:putative Holliday junction resolvase